MSSLLFTVAGRVNESLLIVLALGLAFAAQPASAADPAQVEVRDNGVVLTYLGQPPGQREVQRGDRFAVVRTSGSMYVVRDAGREALLPIASAIPAAAPAAQTSFVVATAKAPIAECVGRSRVPGTVEPGTVLEVLARHPLGTTLYVRLASGRTAEIAHNLVRAAKPEQQPRALPVGPYRGPVPLGCEISIDQRGNVYAEIIYVDTLGQRIGLQPGTQIIRVNGQEIHSAADYDRASALLGGHLRLVVQRPGLDYPELIEYRAQ